MIEITASKGLGDAIYLRAIVLHLIERRERVVVFTQWPDLFSDLPVEVKPLTCRTGDEDLRHAKPCLHCRIAAVGHLDAFSMACLQAGITEPVRLRMDWVPRNRALVERVRRAAAGRPILAFQPLKRATTLSQALERPDRAAYARFIAREVDCFRVKLGHPRYTQDSGHPACDLDLFGALSVTDALDVLAISARAFGEPCYVTIAAEAMGKPFTCMFSRRGVDSGHRYASNLKPSRTFHGDLGRAVFDDEVEAACAS